MFTLLPRSIFRVQLCASSQILQIPQICKSIPVKWDTSTFMDRGAKKYGQRVEPFQKAPDITPFGPN